MLNYLLFSISVINIIPISRICCRNINYLVSESIIGLIAHKCVDISPINLNTVSQIFYYISKSGVDLLKLLQV